MHFPHIRWPRRLYTIFIIPTQACAPRHICSNFNAIFFFFVFFNCIVLMGKSIFCHYGHSKKNKDCALVTKKFVCENIWINDNWRQWPTLFVVDGVDNNSNYNQYNNNNNKKKKRKAGKNALANKNIFMHVTCFCHVFSMQLCSCFYVFSYPGIYLMARQKD